jgi:hypothetical protein
MRARIEGDRRLRAKLIASLLISLAVVIFVSYIGESMLQFVQRLVDVF